MTRKWKREVDETVPGVRAVIVASITDLERLHATTGAGPLFAIMSRERAKLSYRWQPAIVERWATVRGRLVRHEETGESAAHRSPALHRCAVATAAGPTPTTSVNRLVMNTCFGPRACQIAAPGRSSKRESAISKRRSKLRYAYSAIRGSGSSVEARSIGLPASPESSGGGESADFRPVGRLTNRRGLSFGSAATKARQRRSRVDLSTAIAQVRPAFTPRRRGCAAAQHRLEGDGVLALAREARELPDEDLLEGRVVGARLVERGLPDP